MNVFSAPDPTIKEFLQSFELVANESSVDGVNVGSHPSFPARVTVEVENSDDDYELVGIDVNRMFGCGCWTGPRLAIRKTVKA